MKISHFITTTLILFCAQIIQAKSWDMSEEDNWIEDGWFSRTNYLEKAQNFEKQKNYSDAATAYEMIFRLTSNPNNKALALFKKAEVHQKAGQLFQASETYTELISRYPTQDLFSTAIDRLFEIGKLYQASRDKMFSDNRSKALKVYKTIIEVAPYCNQAAQVLLQMATLQEDSFESEQGILNYEKLIKKYKNYPIENSAAYLNLAHVYNETAKVNDSDRAITQKGLHLVNSFLEKFPEHTRTEEAKALKQELRNRIGEYYYKLGLFYTWEANYSRKAARRYLHQVLFEFSETPAADKAEKLLASVDPNSEEIIAKAKGEVVVKEKSKQDIKLEPFTSAQNSKEWEKQQPIPTEKQNSDKWLLPVPNIKGDTK